MGNTVYDNNGNLIYRENSNGFWVKYDYDDNNNRIYYENSNGYIIDNRPKGSCNGKVIDIEGKKYGVLMKIKIVKNLIYLIGPVLYFQEKSQDLSLDFPIIYPSLIKI